MEWPVRGSGRGWGAGDVLSAVLVAVGFLIVVLGIAAAALVYAAKHGGIIEYEPVPGTPCFVNSSSDVDRSVLRAALFQAVSCLSQYTQWPHDTVTATLAGLHVFVRDEPSWWSFGRHVSGETTSEAAVVVGRDLKALCHELAHATELRLYGRTDETHATWQTNGIQRALDAFESPGLRVV